MITGPTGFSITFEHVGDPLPGDDILLLAQPGWVVTQVRTKPQTYLFLSDVTFEVFAPASLDSDGDGEPDATDNCPQDPNSDQSDADADGIGNACNDHGDLDGDEWSDVLDNCPGDPNPNQEDADLDLLGDICDPFPNHGDNEQAQCEADLAVCEAGFTDSDGDGVTDLADQCPGSTPADVDAAGCTIAQFCSPIDVTTSAGRKVCKRSDWKNDEPVMKSKDRDCNIQKNGAGRDDDECVPAAGL